MSLLLAMVLATASAPVDSGTAQGWLAQSDAPVRQVDYATRLQAMRTEYAMLEGNRPGVALPVILWSVGGHLGLGGIVLLLSSSSGVGKENLVLPGVALAVTGLGMVAIGIVIYVIRYADRKVMGDRMDELERQISATQNEMRMQPELPPPVPLPRERPPEEVPAPLQVKREGVFFAFTVAEF